MRSVRREGGTETETETDRQTEEERERERVGNLIKQQQILDCATICGLVRPRNTDGHLENVPLKMREEKQL